MSRSTTWTPVREKFGGNRSKESGRSGASFISQKNNGSATHLFALSPKPIARFRWKRARLSLLRPQPHLPSFIQIHPSFRDIGSPIIQESRAVARKPRDAAAVLFGSKFSDNIHYKLRQASKARLHSSKHTGIKQNLRQNGDSRSFKVTCFGVSGKAIRQ